MFMKHRVDRLFLYGKFKEFSLRNNLRYSNHFIE